MIHIRIPFALDKDLGKAYNEACKDIPEGDYILLMDYDVLILTPETIQQLYKYIKLYPAAALLTCYTQRTANKFQLYPAGMTEVATLTYHIQIARKLERYKPQIRETLEPISGFFMLFSKAWWNKVKFPEGGKCLGVDTEFSRNILAAGGRILCMDTVYVWHTYRLMEGMNYKLHLL